jgi:hypothetical protein
VAFAEPRDEVGIDVDAGDVVTELSEASSRDRAHVAAAEDRDPFCRHQRGLSPNEFVLVTLYIPPPAVRGAALP